MNESLLNNRLAIVELFLGRGVGLTLFELILLDGNDSSQFDPPVGCLIFSRGVAPLFVV